MPHAALFCTLVYVFEPRVLNLAAQLWCNSAQVYRYVCAQPAAFKMAILRAGNELYCERLRLQLSVVLSVMSVSGIARPCVRVIPFFFPPLSTLPGAPLVLEALIGPELDRDGPDY